MAVTSHQLPSNCPTYYLWAFWELVLRRDELAPRVTRRREREEKRIGTAARELHLHVAPRFVGVVVKERPRLERRFVIAADDEAVRRAPHGSLGDVAERDGRAGFTEEIEHALVQ